jgi:hypothetical protein
MKMSIFFRLQRESNYLRRRKKQYLLPLQQFRGRQPLIPVDPVAPVDIPRDIAVGHKRNVWARTNSARGRGTCITSRHIPRGKETKEIFELCLSHEPHH